MIDSIHQALIERGWCGPEGDTGQKYVWASREMFPNRPTCDCNERKALLVVTHHCFDVPGAKHVSYTVEMRFEKQGRWYDLKAYNLMTLAEIDESIEPIIAAGNAVAATQVVL